MQWIALVMWSQRQTHWWQENDIQSLQVDEETNVQWNTLKLGI